MCFHASQARSSPSLPPGSKAVTLEELEREYLTPSPSNGTNSASQPTDHTPPPGVAPPPGITTANAPPTGPAQLMGPLPPPPMGQVPPMGIHVSESVVQFFQLLYLFNILSLASSPYDGRMGDAPSWKVPISPRIPSPQGATTKCTNQATSRYMALCVWCVCGVCVCVREIHC